MRNSKYVFNVLEGEFQHIEYDEDRLNPLYPFKYVFVLNHWLLVPDYIEEVGNA